MKLVVIVGLGSFIGGAGRYLLSMPFQNKLLFVFPFGTLIANIVGCFVIGILFSLIEKEMVGAEWRFFFVTGLLGGFTTFSSFSLETIEMLKDGYFLKAILYVSTSVIICLSATALGIYLFKD